MKLNILTTAKQVKDLNKHISDKDYAAFDTETTGLSKQDTVIGYSVCADWNEAYYVILGGWNKDTKQLEMNNDPEFLAENLKVYQLLATKKLVMHNAVFDCMMAEYALKVPMIDALYVDTMILAHLLDENRRVALKELAKAKWGAASVDEQQDMLQSIIDNGGKATRKEMEIYKGDPMLVAKYGAKDAILTFRLFNELIVELYDQKLDKFFFEESMPLLKGPTYEMNTTGLRVDSQRYDQVRRELTAECEEAKAFIHTEIKRHVKDKFGDKFNLKSKAQLSWLMFSRLNLPFNKLTKCGLDLCNYLNIRRPYTLKDRRNFIETVLANMGKEYVGEMKTLTKTVRAKKIGEPWQYIVCDKKVINGLADKHDWIRVLLEYQAKEKLLSVYIKGVEDKIKYGIIQPGFLQHGTTSGRYSSRGPNFQNLPRNDKRIKECFAARPGKKFVGADYSQLEPRVFAYFSKDQRLQEAFSNGTDFYSVIGMEVYGKYDCEPQKDGDNAFGTKYKKLRDSAKVIALASVYGASARQLSTTTGKPEDETQEDIDAYFERFPDVKKMMLESYEDVKKTGVSLNLFGRPRRLPAAKRISKMYGNMAHANLPYEQRKLLNLSVNHKIQSTAASIVNRAMIQLYNDCKAAGINCKLISQVHDSIIVECDASDAENVAILMQCAMQHTVELKGVELEAIPRIGNNLSEV